MWSVLLPWVQLYDTWGQYTSVRPVSTARCQYYYLESNYMTHEDSTHQWDQYLLLDVSTTTLSPIIWHMRTVHISETSIYCKMSVLLPWGPVYDTWGQYTSVRPVSTARCQYYYLESNYMTHEDSTHQWDQYLLLDVSTTTLRPSIWHMRSVHISETKFLLQDVITTAMRPSIWHMRSVHISETKYLLLDIITTTLRPSIWHMRSVHISETKYPLLDVSTTTLRPRIWHIR